MTQRDEALLVLRDGTAFRGRAFGHRGEAVGEVVFNTAMTGYQEILTDPSYKGQIVTMTYPHIGNYGTNGEDIESSRPHLEGFVVREISRVSSNFRSTAALEDYLRLYSIVGIDGIDTRALTRHLREKGSMDGVLSSTDLDVESLRRKAAAAPSLVGRDLVREVSRHDRAAWTEGLCSPLTSDLLEPVGDGLRVVAMDYGIKANILRSLVASGFQVPVFPATTPLDDVLALDPDGVLLSNGPGDPEPITYAIDFARGLLKREVPVFGICLGHQILALALGAKIFKLKFGHHGANQPVLNLREQRVEITSQNHGFAADPTGLDPAEVEVTHVNLNDRTLEGLRHRRLPAFSVQYQPEASPGPHDSLYLFKEFATLIQRVKR